MKMTKGQCRHLAEQLLESLLANTELEDILSLHFDGDDPEMEHDPKSFELRAKEVLADCLFEQLASS